MSWVFESQNTSRKCTVTLPSIYIWDLVVLLFMDSSLCTVCTVSDFFSGLYFVKIWPINYALHFGSAKIYEHCLYWSVFSTDINRKIIFNVCYLLSYFCWSRNYMSQVSKFHISSRRVQKLRLGLCLMAFSIVIYGKLNSNFPVFFYLFFIRSVNCSSHFLVTFCWSVSYMSWTLDFRDVQKLKHWFIFETF